MFAASLLVLALQDPHVPEIPDDPEFRSQIQLVGGPQAPVTVDPKSVHTAAQLDADATLRGLLEPAEMVVGVRVGGEARAWPIDLIARTEVLNDTVAGVPVVLTWCVMCQTAIVYRRTVKGSDGETDGERVLTIGNARATFQHNLVAYDSETSSFWQQATGDALYGPLKGNALAPVPSILCTWSAWKRSHPDATVVADDGPSNRQRSKFRLFQEFGSEYAGLVLRVGTTRRFYPVEILAEKRLVEDTLQDMKLFVVFDREQRLAAAWRRPNEHELQLQVLEVGDAKVLAIVEQDGPGKWDAATGLPLHASAAKDPPTADPAAKDGDPKSNAASAPLEPMLMTPMSWGRYARLFPEASRFGPPHRVPGERGGKR
jgi:hypothetical protein